MSRLKLEESSFINLPSLIPAGLTFDMIAGGISYVYEMLDKIDETLVSSGSVRIAEMFELANVSSMVGNLLAAGVANVSGGAFERNRPHKYPDLLAKQPHTKDIEIKMALETNNPKGHLAKAGYYLTCRYVLCDEEGVYTSGMSNRGSVVWIWEVRFGWLDEAHFNVSNTSGDSGKTAVVNAEGIKQLAPVYVSLEHCPYPPKGRTFKALKALYPENPDNLQLF